MNAAHCSIRNIWRRAARPGVLSLTLSLSACGVERKVNAWMWCDECIEKQRGRVELLGNRAVPTLAGILNSLPPERVALLRRQIADSYQPDSALTQEQYVDLMLESYVARSQIRSAVSLGDIATRPWLVRFGWLTSADARAELEKALTQADTRGYRRDVVHAIAVALAQASNLPPPPPPPPPASSVEVTPATDTVVVAPRATLLTIGQQALLAANNPVTWKSSSTNVASVSATGNVIALATGSSTITATSNADPSKKDSVIVRVYPPAGPNWIISAPAAADTVTSAATTVIVAALAIGPTATFQNPFAIVEFWARTSGSGVWRLIGQVPGGSAVLSDNGVNRTHTYSSPWNPAAVFATPSLTQVEVIAIGITSGGTISSSPLNALLSVRVP